MSSHSAMRLNAFDRPIRVAHPASARNRSTSVMQFAKTHWKKISAALLSGVFAGFLAAAVSSRTQVSVAQVVYAATPAATHIAHASSEIRTNQDMAAEISRLRTQNRELQELVGTLRKHPQAVRTHRARARRHWRVRTG